MIAALYIQAGGCYFGLPNVDPWPESRDARKYAGPWPVVAHPPCARWGRMAEVAFGRRHGGKLGDDNGCFAAALASVREWGGVLEHPAGSRAYDANQLIHPPHIRRTGARGSRPVTSKATRVASSRVRLAIGRARRHGSTHVGPGCRLCRGASRRPLDT